MNIFRKIMSIWVVAVVAYGLGLILLPNDGPSMTSLALDFSSLLAGLVCFFVFLRESKGSNRAIFMNFALFFLISSALSFAYKFIGSNFAFLSNNARYYFYQYEILSFYLLLSFAVLFVVIDSFFNDIRTVSKYLVTLLIVGGTFAYYYYPYLENPRYLATTEDWRDFTAVSESVVKLAKGGNTTPSVKEIASATELAVWRGGEKVGVLFEEQKVNRISQLLPYLSESNFEVLLYRPLYLSNIYMNVLCVVFIFVFFGYQYKNDPPQGAYIEKIIFLFLPYCSLEILHHYAYIKSIELSTFDQVREIGIYLTLANVALLLVFFSLRLRFITSVKGEFYERELVSDAEHISRWRDAFDNLVVRHFLNPKAIHGRLLAPRSPRGEA